MSKKNIEQPVQVIETTIGELIEAITQIALSSTETEEEGYFLASRTVEDILSRGHKDYDLTLH